MKVGEIYYPIDDPLSIPYEVLRIEHKYAYLGRFNGGCCKMRAHFLPHGLGDWRPTRSAAIKARMKSLTERAESYEELLRKYLVEEAAARLEAREAGIKP